MLLSSNVVTVEKCSRRTRMQVSDIRIPRGENDQEKGITKNNCHGFVSKTIYTPTPKNSNELVDSKKMKDVGGADVESPCLLS